MTEFLHQHFGAIEFPTAAADVVDEQLFSAFDPGRDALASLFRTAINVELASAWAVARAGTALADRDPVADTTYQLPTKALLREAKFSYPLLAVYRMTAAHNERTLAREQITTTWGVDYILGPLTAADQRRLTGALSGVVAALRLVIRRNGHPEYQGGAVQFFSDTSGFSSIAMTSTAYGPADYGESGEGAEYHAVHVELETSELDGWLPDADAPLEGATMRVNVGDEREIVPDTIIAVTDP